MTYETDISDELLKALVRVLEQDKPDLRQQMRAKLEEAARKREEGGNAKAAAELREYAGLGFLNVHR